jgi:hypothetical protein
LPANLFSSALALARAQQAKSLGIARGDEPGATLARETLPESHFNPTEPRNDEGFGTLDLKKAETLRSCPRTRDGADVEKGSLGSRPSGRGLEGLHSANRTEGRRLPLEFCGVGIKRPGVRPPPPSPRDARMTGEARMR